MFSTELKTAVGSDPSASTHKASHHWKTLLRRTASTHGRSSREYGILKRAISVAHKIVSWGSGLDRDDLIGSLVLKGFEVSSHPNRPVTDDDFYAYLWRALKNEAIKVAVKHQKIAKSEIVPQGVCEENLEETLERLAQKNEAVQVEDWHTPIKSPRMSCAQLSLAKYVTFLPHKQKDPIITRLRERNTTMGYSGLSSAEWREALTGQLKTPSDPFKKPVALAVHALQQMDLTYKEIAEVCGLPRTEAKEKQVERKLKENVESEDWKKEIAKYVGYVFLTTGAQDIRTVIDWCMGERLTYARANANRRERWRLIEEGVHGLRHPDDCGCPLCSGAEIALPGTFARMLERAFGRGPDPRIVVRAQMERRTRDEKTGLCWLRTGVQWLWLDARPPRPSRPPAPHLHKIDGRRLRPFQTIVDDAGRKVNRRLIIRPPSRPLNSSDEHTRDLVRLRYCKIQETLGPLQGPGGPPKRSNAKPPRFAHQWKAATSTTPADLYQEMLREAIHYTDGQRTKTFGLPKQAPMRLLYSPKDPQDAKQCIGYLTNSKKRDMPARVDSWMIFGGGYMPGWGKEEATKWLDEFGFRKAGHWLKEYGYQWEKELDAYTKPEPESKGTVLYRAASSRIKKGTVIRSPHLPAILSSFDPPSALPEVYFRENPKSGQVWDAYSGRWSKDVAKGARKLSHLLTPEMRIFLLPEPMEIPRIFEPTTYEDTQGQIFWFDAVHHVAYIGSKAPKNYSQTWRPVAGAITLAERVRRELAQLPSPGACQVRDRPIELTSNERQPFENFIPDEVRPLGLFLTLDPLQGCGNKPEDRDLGNGYKPLSVPELFCEILCRFRFDARLNICRDTRNVYCPPLGDWQDDFSVWRLGAHIHYASPARPITECLDGTGPIVSRVRRAIWAAHGRCMNVRKSENSLSETLPSEIVLI
jgi:hypothetical protein